MIQTVSQQNFSEAVPVMYASSPRPLSEDDRDGLPSEDDKHLLMRGINVLYVEDSVLSQNVMKQLLRQHGARCIKTRKP